MLCNNTKAGAETQPLAGDLFELRDSGTGKWISATGEVNYDPSKPAGSGTKSVWVIALLQAGPWSGVSAQAPAPMACDSGMFRC